MTYEHICQELLQMKEKDQSEPYSLENAKIRAKRLQEIIREIGWPSEEILGDASTEIAAFLIVQHSNDTPFQEYCLALIKKLPLHSWQRKQSVAFLTDRILVNKELPQLYGTQFRGKEPFPIQDPDNLEKRRKEMELEPFVEYQEYMQKHAKEEPRN